MIISWRSHEWVELLDLNDLYHSFVKTRYLITAQVLIRFQSHACGIRRMEGGGGFAVGRFSSVIIIPLRNIVTFFSSYRTKVVVSKQFVSYCVGF